MTPDAPATAGPAMVAGGTPARSTRTVAGGLAARRAVRSGALWGVVFGITVASSALGYRSLYRTTAQRRALADAYGTNHAMSTLFGPAPDLQTVAGFTAFKVTMALMLIGAVWGLLLGTRLLRGEEDAGRWEVLLAGQTTMGRATAQVLAGLGAGVATLWAVTAVATTLVGRARGVHIGPGPALYFALAVVATSAVFIGVGAVTSQLAASRRRAAAWAAVVLGVAYAVRMVADAGIGLHGLVWASPLGWVEEAAPLTGPRPLALLPMGILCGALAVGAAHLAGRRDVGTGLVPDRTRARARTGLLGGTTGLAVRLARPTVLGWWVAVALSGLLYGLIARSAGSTITGSAVHQVLAKLGATGTGADAVLGVCFLILAVLVAFAAAGQCTAARAEESSGRLDNLLTRPVAPAGWLGGRLAVALAAVTGGGLLGGTAAWLGASSQGAGVRFPLLLAAGVNLVPPAAVVLGLGALTLGLAPRATAAVVYGYLGWSLLVVVVGGIGGGDHWVLDTSVLHQMSAAPAVPVDWTADGIMAAVAVVAAGVGLAAFARRDLAPA